MSKTTSPNFLVILDVDSTLIQEEVVEVLADFAGKRAQVQAVTERAMLGELDFTGSLKARVIELKGLDEKVISQALSKITVTPGALELIAEVKKRGGAIGAVSGGFNQLLEPLAKELGLDFYRANQLEIIDGVLTGEVLDPIIDKPAKAKALKEWAAECSLELQRTIAIGDGANDLDMMGVAGLSIGFNAKPRVRAKADVLIDSNNLADVIALLGR